MDLPLELQLQHRARTEGGWIEPWHAQTLVEDGRDGDHHEPMALLMSRQGRIDDALALLPRARGMNLYTPPALRPKIRGW